MTAVVAFGPTQSGKSTFVTCVADEGAAVAVGDGDGESVTVEAKLYQSEKLQKPLLDTPGINDSLLRFTNAEAGRRVALGVAAAGVRDLQFIVFDSLANDSMQLRNTLVEFTQAFGRDVLPSVLVLASKADRLPKAQKEKRLQKMEEVAKQQGVRQVLEWQNVDIAPEAMELQLAKLRKALERVPPASTKDLQDLHSRVEARARQLFEKAPLQTKEVQVEEQYVEPYDFQEAYEEPYVVTELRDETYTDLVPYTDTVQKDVPNVEVERWPLIAKILTLGIVQDEFHVRTKKVNVDVTKYREVTRTRQVPWQKTEHRTAYRTVTRHRAKTRRVSKSVEYQVPMEQFRERALVEITAEMRAALTACTGIHGAARQGVPEARL